MLKKVCVFYFETQQERPGKKRDSIQACFPNAPWFPYPSDAASETPLCKRASWRDIGPPLLLLVYPDGFS